MVKCKKNKKQYARQTGNSAEDRFVRHRNTVVQECYRGTYIAVGEHFHSHSATVSYCVRYGVHSCRTDIQQQCFCEETKGKEADQSVWLLRRGLNRNL